MIKQKLIRWIEKKMIKNKSSDEEIVTNIEVGTEFW